jgi:hypothetical protein
LGEAPQTWLAVLNRSGRFTVEIHELTRQQAELWRAFVEQRHEPRLVELSHWIHETGGPIDLLDGSLESLVELWEWFVDFVDEGLPGIDSRVRYSLGWAFGWPGGNHGATYYATESLGSYVFEVLRRLDPATTWTVNVPVGRTKWVDSDQHRTGIAFRGSWVSIDPRIANVASRLFDHGTAADDEAGRQASRPERLRDLVANLFHLVDSPTVRGASILTPLASEPVLLVPVPMYKQPPPPPAEPEPVPVLVSVAEAQAMLTPGESPSTAGEPMILLSRRGDAEHLEAAPALSERRVFRVLQSLGAETLSGEPLSQAMLRDPEVERLRLLRGAVTV